MEEMVKIVHNDYDKISDTVFWLNNEWIVKFTVVLNKYINGKRENFHKEFGYNKKGNYAVCINRSFQYYLQIESIVRDSNGFKDTIAITQEDIYFFNFKLKNAIKWFTGDSNVFAKKNGQIFIPSKVYSERVNLRFGGYIELEPAVLNPNNSSEQLIGVMLYLGNDVISCFVDVNRFLSFTYFIANFNMYLAAQGMLSYIGMQNYGINYTDLNSGSTGNGGYNNQYKGSFFDKVGSTEREEE